MDLVEDLIDCCYKDIFPSSHDVLQAFGFENIPVELHSTLLGIYQGIVKIQAVSKKYLYDAYKSNRLDEFIDARYDYSPNYYYQAFKSLHMRIGNTCNEPIEDKTPFITQIQCPVCKKKNLNNGRVECVKCYQFVCNDCYKIINDDEQCYQCAY